jgi:hypothetical protein
MMHAMACPKAFAGRWFAICRTTAALLIVLSLPGGVRGDEPDAATREGWRRISELGSGFVVWESNRTGRWRLWGRELD